MADNKTGPVRPPIIEGQARKSDDGAKANTSQNSASKSSATKPSAQKPQSGRKFRIWPTALASAVGGGVIGGAITLAVLNSGLSPALMPDARDDAARTELDTLRGRITMLEQTTNDLSGLPATTSQSIGVLSATQDELSGLIAALRAQSDALSASDLSQTDDIMAQNQTITELSSQMTELSQLLDDLLVNEPENLDVAPDIALNAALDTMRTNLADMQQALDDQQDSITTNQQQVESLATRLDDMNNAITTLSENLGTTIAQIETQAEQAANPAPTPALTLDAITALDQMVRSGAPFEAELTTLAGLLPSLPVPASVAQHASSGLPTTDAIATRFTDAMPDMIGQIAPASDLAPTDQVATWLQSLFAVRSANVDAGDPLSVLSTIEQFLLNGNPVTAHAQTERLPQEIIQSQPQLFADLAALATTYTFIDTARTQTSDSSSGEPQ